VNLVSQGLFVPPKSRSHQEIQRNFWVYRYIFSKYHISEYAGVDNMRNTSISFSLPFLTLKLVLWWTLGKRLYNVKQTRRKGFGLAQARLPVFMAEVAWHSPSPSVLFYSLWEADWCVLVLMFNPNYWLQTKDHDER